MHFGLSGHIRRSLVAVTALCLLLAQLTVSVQAQETGRTCQPGQPTQFVFGFAALKSQLGDVMGEPASCEYADPNGSGDTLQDTTTGLAFWRKSTNTATFTNGGTHWALTGSGFVSWIGSSIDPPSGAATAQTADATAVSDATPAPAVEQPQVSQPPADLCGATSNPWNFTYCGGQRITSPPSNLCTVFACIPSFWNQTRGYVMQCSDGLLSHSGGIRGSCSGHGGNSRPLYSP
jgi:hypothetical protein